MTSNRDKLPWTVVVPKTLRAGMLGLGLAACTSAAARVPEDRDAGRSTRGASALDRTLVAGTLIEATIGSNTPLTATVSADVMNAHRWVVIPAGCLLTLRIARRRSARMSLDVTSVTIRGQVTPMSGTIELAPAAVHQSAGDIVVASGTRVLFVLPEGFTAAMRREAIP